MILKNVLRIINEPTAEVPEKVFEEFLNLVNPKSHLIDDEDILRFVEKYGLLFFNNTAY